MIDFFISYAREDAEYARALVTHLSASQLSVWIDEKDIPPSVPWMTEIQRAIDSSMIMLVIESEDWLSSSACHIELQLAELGRVPVARIKPNIADVAAQAERLGRAHSALPDWRAVSLDAAASAAIWDAAGRKGSLLNRGRAVSIARRELRKHPDDFSPAATTFIKASSRAATRRLVAGLMLGLTVPVLLLGIGIGATVLTTTNSTVNERVADATSAAERKTYSNWNVYAGLERAPGDISNSFSAYRELFIALTERTPLAWDPTPVIASGPVSTQSPDGSSTATADGAQIVVSDASGGVRRLLAGAPVTAVAWSPDSRWIAVATDDGADVISVLNGQVIALRGGIGSMSAVSWDDPATVSVGGSAGTGTWRVFDGKEVGNLGSVRYGTTVGDTLYSVDTSGVLTSTTIAVGSSESAVVPTDPVKASPSAIDSAGSTVVIAFGGGDPFLRVVETSTGSVRDVATPGCSPLGLSLVPDGSAAYVACAQAQVNESRVDLATGAMISQPYQVQQEYGVRVLDDRVVWGGAYGGVFQTGFDLSPQGPLTTEAGCGAPQRKFIGPSDGSMLFPIGDATASFSCGARIEISSRVAVHRLIFRATDGHAIPDAAMSPDGTLIAYGLSDGQVRVFTTDQFVPLYFAQVLPDQVRSVSFASDGESLIVAGLGGEIVTVALPYTSEAEATDSLVDDALTRLQDALDWGIYARTTDPSER